MDILVTRHRPEAIERIAVRHGTAIAEVREHLVCAIECFRQRRIVVVGGVGHAAMLGRSKRSRVIVSASGYIRKEAVSG
jgi:hypothetical protein